MTDINNNAEQENRAAELLAGRTLGDLTPEESAELGDLLSNQPHYETDDFDRVAAALVSGSLRREPLPSHLKQRILQSAEPYLTQSIPAKIERSTSSVRETLGWIVAVACLLLVTIQNWPQQPVQPPTLSMAQQIQEILNSDSKAIQVAWGKGLHPFEQEVQGDVVWSNAQQKGFMTFSNMPINDPTIEQYQLWIIDPSRDDEPIDGGVFDVTQAGEVIVPIDAKLNVISPQAFAITIEKPGGVVVSTQERLPLLAPVDA